jgi:acetyl esterase/lipase
MKRLLWAAAAAFVILSFCVNPVRAQAQLPADLGWAAELSGLLTSYWITPNVTYLTANNVDLKLDIYQATNGSFPTPALPARPTLMYIHGGGWTGLSKESSSLAFLPFLQMGWNVVNIDYRVARVSPAPAAVEDCLCALRWIYRNAKQYNIDTNRLVVSGESSGGHLALTTGMVPASAGLDRQCPGTEALKVSAIINWFGIDDVAELLDGPHTQQFAVTWLGSTTNRDEIARRVSPLSYVRPALPPILTIHGDADPLVPYSQAVRLRDALTKAGVPNELVTVQGGKHGSFTRQDMRKVYGSIVNFLSQHGLNQRQPHNNNPLEGVTEISGESPQSDLF